MGARYHPLGPWPRELEDWLDTHWQDCTCRIPLLEIILENLGEWLGGPGGGGRFFSICLFLSPSGEDINIFKMVVNKLTKALN